MSDLPVFNVADFGAKGDGINDDTAEIQAAIDAAHAAGGGVVVMGAGTFKVSGSSDKSDGCLQMLDNVTLQGAGMGVTTIKVRDNNAWDITGVIRTPFNEETHNVGLYDLTIDGNRANNTKKIDGFYTGVRPEDTRQDSDITVERVEVMNCTGYGFDPHEQTIRLRIADSVSHHNVLDGFVADFLVDSVYENNIAYANDRHGFNVTTSTFNLQLIGNISYDNGSTGLVIQRGSEDIPSPHDIVVTGGSYFNNAREGILVKIADDVLISGVEVYGNQRQGIRLDGTTGVIVDGSTIRNNSQAGTDLYDEIRINRYNDTSGSSGQIFGSTDNRVQNSNILAEAAARARYGIYEALDVTGVNSVFNNTISGTVRGASYFAPQLVTPGEDQTGDAGVPFSYQIAPGSFVDGDHGAVTLSASLAGWLSFDPLTGQFSGTPPVGASYDIQVRATDAQGLSDITVFELVVTGANVVDIVGTSGADTLVGGNGAENLYGLAGDDVLIGGGGPDYLDGDSGSDTASYATSAGGVIVSLEAGTASGGDAQGDTFRLVENLTGSAFADELTGDGYANVLLGGAGADILRGRGGADTLDGGTGADHLEGGDGDDTYYIDNAGDVIVEAFNSGLGGTDTVLSTISRVLAEDDVENVVLLGTANLDATGNGKANHITGNSGDNLLDGGASNDTLVGGLGNDTYVVNTSKDVIVELADGGIDTVRSTSSRTLDNHLENLTLLGASNINATGNALANVLTGNAGVNNLTGNAGDDTLIGGGGNDTLKGGAGIDVLNGGTGADRMEGGDDNDFYVVDNTGDTVTESFNSGKGGLDSVASSVSFTLGNNVENLTLTGSANINATGNNVANVLIGNDGANVLDAHAGNDTLLGGLGNDRLIGRTGSDILDGGAGHDTAVFLGTLPTHTISTSAGGLFIKDRDDLTDGNGGKDQLIGIETLEFKNGVTVNLAAAVVIDLDGDGIELIDLASSTTTFDFQGSGQNTRTAWIGAGDALLVFDRDGDGTVSDIGELSFLGDEAGARSGLDALSAFDTSGDGLLSAADFDFSRFKLWSDNGNGAVDAGELVDLGTAVTAIALSGTATAKTWASGANIVVNEGSVTEADGGTATLADVFLLHDNFGSGGILI